MRFFASLVCHEKITAGRASCEADSLHCRECDGPCVLVGGVSGIPREDLDLSLRKLSVIGAEHEQFFADSCDASDAVATRCIDCIIDSCTHTPDISEVMTRMLNID